ncbi:MULTISPECIES: hypothetical protein [Brevibacillus]|jgi:hypothetical protein|uniref:Uncharacterized protein n=1 Tax=Brevibacillus parabrevis TaxID=54914 RepID=A0A4Y3PJ60_BREPA|nr:MULTISPECIES: hypothetical protein [Brevibacillus]MBU8712999.1 hypothetical protein [Brevibacillus parabrevis]MDH6348518.1 cbb3-type cytochrome oxidase subunit 3 [Brevibacillus sp. 1238]MDR5002335.1 hypothetical protein [Brevibacillus parabrevis]MED1723395.1 hypothetical protein [Brevibacillus parabrevis]MED2256392.1 hypothetical protein [Brevibacillus parabrevis]
MIFFTVVIFFAFLLVVWFVVKLLFRLEKRDSIKYDQRELWESFDTKLQDIRYKKEKNK